MVNPPYLAPPCHQYPVTLLQVKTDKYLKDITHFKDLVCAVMGGYSLHPHVSFEIRDLFEKALAPKTKSDCKRAWVRFSSFARETSFDPKEAWKVEVLNISYDL